MSLLRFLNSVRKHWWPLMSCAVFTFLGMWILYAQKSSGWALRAMFACAVFCMFWACYLAWRDEEKRANNLEIQLRNSEKLPRAATIQNIYLPPQPQVVKLPEHNVQCGGVEIQDHAVTISFQNVPIPGTRLGDFRKALLSVEYKMESTGKEWLTLFPARWIAKEGESVSIGVVPMRAFLAAYFELQDRTWEALWNDRIKGTILPPDRYLIKATLIGENNISLKPITGILVLGRDGSASWDTIPD